MTDKWLHTNLVVAVDVQHDMCHAVATDVWLTNEPLTSPSGMLIHACAFQMFCLVFSFNYSMHIIPETTILKECTAIFDASHEACRTISPLF